MLTFIQIILFFYPHKLHIILLFSIMVTGFHTYAYKNDNLKVVTIRILVFIGGCILAFLMWGGWRGACPTKSTNKPESEFLTSQTEYSWYCECMGSCQATKNSMMKSSTLLKCGPLPSYFKSTSCPPDIAHVVSVPKHPCFSLLFHFSVLYWPQTEEQNEGDLGMMLYISWPQSFLQTAVSVYKSTNLT